MSLTTRAGLNGSPFCKETRRRPAHSSPRSAIVRLLLGLAADQPVRVDDAGFIATSFPGFADLMRELGFISRPLDVARYAGLDLVKEASQRLQ